MARTKLQMYIDVITGGGAGVAAVGRKGGWSEGVYDNTELSETGKAQFRKLCQKRAALLPNTAAVVAQRYQSVDPLGPSGVELARFPGTAGRADYPALSLYCRVAGDGVRNTRPVFLRGIPDAFIVDGEYAPNPDYRRRVETYFNELAGYAFRAQNLAAAQSAIIAIDANGVFTLEEDIAGLVDRKRVVVKRANVTLTEKQKGGTFVVRINDESVMTLVGWKYGAATGGRMLLQSYIFPEITRGSQTTGRIVTKKIGSPFEKFVGRHSKRA